ncbi:hypothetical protein [Symbioplanes lichenis]|uniref:hypothetical protein n=1 Tax=Symbioplanes lichenis TaxID=1629072 RepID=UPI002738393D|nr:hypothetical protein [Actinoplanes lichenis]
MCGVYVSRGDLRADPATRPGGVAVRGPAAARLGIHTDWPAPAASTQRDLQEYWVPWTTP